MVEPTTIYLANDHEFFSEWKYFAQSDCLDVKVIDGETRIC